MQEILLPRVRACFSAVRPRSAKVSPLILIHAATIYSWHGHGLCYDIHAAMCSCRQALPIGSALSGLVNMPPIGAQGSYGRAVPCIAAQRCTSKRGGGALGEEMMYRKLLSSRRWQRCTRVLLSV